LFLLLSTILLESKGPSLFPALRLFLLMLVSKRRLSQFHRLFVSGTFFVAHFFYF